ncbi:hypothetical protein DPMN_105569 [Dreissena polymorpha]|uniref:Uncharacterized protein n=1 Tax=Dreissena polymorpha TaxID=45954 RepID=A0A9D4QHM0_DREPO|nr:hypothetical protein DPMN_105569 [Dreissena polymorpha]
MLQQLCWLCPAALHSRKELKSHAGTEHQRLDIICPWCVEDVPTIMSRPYDLKRHVGRWHEAIADGLNQDIFTEAGAFYLALYPKDYSKVVKPLVFTIQAAKEAREAVNVWRETSQAPKLKKMEDWEAGWKLAEGKTADTPTIQESGSPTPGVEAYSPTKPAMLPTGGRLPVPFPKMEETTVYTATPIEGPALPFNSATTRPPVETFLLETPLLEEQNKHMQEEMTLQQRALHLLTWGCMPLVPSARRNWDRLPTVQFKGPSFTMDWPPKDWRLMSPSKRLAVAQHVANMLDSVEGIPVTDPDQIMDKYNFLILPGSIPQPRSTSERRMRIANYVLLSDMVKGRSTNILILQMLEQTFGHRDTSTDEFLTVIEGMGILF